MGVSENMVPRIPQLMIILLPCESCQFGVSMDWTARQEAYLRADVPCHILSSSSVNVCETPVPSGASDARYRSYR